MKVVIELPCYVDGCDNPASIEPDVLYYDPAARQFTLIVGDTSFTSPTIEGCFNAITEYTRIYAYCSECKHWCDYD